MIRKKPNINNIVQGVVYATQTGILLPLKDMPDDIIAQGVLGDGICIIPERDKVLSPVSGRITTIAHSKHAFGITTEDGAEIIVHLGVDTVEMNGLGFSPNVVVGQEVLAGELLCNMDRCLIQEAGYALHTAILLTNGDKYVISTKKQATSILEKEVIFEYREI